jgi:phosphohistidine phosphatase
MSIKSARASAGQTHSNCLARNGVLPNNDYMADRLSLYLVRHAIAADRGDRWADDAERPLTEGGIAKFRRVARGLAEIGVDADRILASPFVRARQTADLLAAALPGEPPVSETPALVPGAAFGDLVEAVSHCRDCAALALVGHEPGIGDLAGRLIGASAPLEFKKGAVCCIDFDAWPPTTPGRLRWFVTPKILKRIGG